MAFVLDASVTAAWAFKDEGSEVADRAFTQLRQGDAIVPSLWWFEVRNTMIMGERRGRIGEQDTAAFLTDLARLPILVDRAPDDHLTLALAREHKLTVYGAAYLALADREGIPITTLDASLRRAAGQRKIPLI